MKLSYDLYYLRNAGILLDLLILMKTIRLGSQERGLLSLRDETSLRLAVLISSPHSIFSSCFC